MSETPTYENSPTPQHTPPQRAEADGAAIASLICAFLLAPAAIVLGHTSRGKARRGGMRPALVATWGTVLGYIATGFWALVIAGAIAAANSGSSGGSSSYQTVPTNIPEAQQEAQIAQSIVGSGAQSIDTGVDQAETVESAVPGSGSQLTTFPTGDRTVSDVIVTYSDGSTDTVSVTLSSNGTLSWRSS